MSSQLLNATEIRDLAKKINLKPTKKLGQNFVIDQNTVEKIVKTAQIDKSSNVIEIGPGLGSLTLALLQTGAKVTAIEIDEKLAKLLPQTAKNKGLNEQNLKVINKDALKIKDSEVDSSVNVLVANLPYNVSVPVILHFLEVFPNIKKYLVMVQSEVADRLASPAGSKTYGAPSVKVQWYGQVKKSFAISRNIFWPVPNVDSDLVEINRSKKIDETMRNNLFTLIDLAFEQRRKMLRSALSSIFGGSEKASLILQSAQIDPQLRGEALSVDDYVRLTNVMRKSGFEKLSKKL
mgnify:FL=1